jgi:hypothetical protein
MNELARALTEKYRAALDIPTGVSISVDEWLAEGQTLAVRGPRKALLGLSATVDLNAEHGECIAEGRAEFSARKKRLEHAALASFKDWTRAVSVKGPAAASTLWQAVMDLRHYRDTWSERAAGAMRWKEQLARAMGKHAGDFVQEGGLNFQQWAGRKLNLSQRVDLRSVYPFEWIAAWAASNWAEEYFTSSPRSILMMSEPAQLDPLIENLTALGDGMLDEVAYPRRIGPMPEGYDPRELGAAEGFRTGFAVKFNYEGVLARKFASPKTLCIVDEPKPRHGVECTLTPEDMRDLANGGTKDVYEQFAINVGTTHQVDRSRIRGYLTLAARFQAYEQELQSIGELGEKLWFERVNSPDPVVGASAMRLLMADLRQILADEWVPGAVKKLAMDQLIERIGDVLPPWAKPFRAALRSGIEGAVDTWAPDRLAQLIEQLDRESIRAALTVAPMANIPRQFPGGLDDLRRRLKVDPSRVPSSCPGGPATLTPSPPVLGTLPTPPSAAAGTVRLKLIDTVVTEWEPYTVDTNSEKSGLITQDGGAEGYENEYEWEPVPGDLSDEGMSMTLTVRTSLSTAPSMALGLGAGSDYGFTFKFYPDPHNVPGQPPLYLVTESTASKSLKVDVKPPTGLTVGSRVSFWIGAAWGPWVEYVYEVER